MEETLYGRRYTPNKQASYFSKYISKKTFLQTNVQFRNESPSFLKLWVQFTPRVETRRQSGGRWNSIKIARNWHWASTWCVWLRPGRVRCKGDLLRLRLINCDRRDFVYRWAWPATVDAGGCKLEIPENWTKTTTRTVGSALLRAMPIVGHPQKSFNSMLWGASATKWQ